VSVLETCRVNDVIGLTYGDKPEERICRVLEVRDTNIHPLSPASLDRRPNIPRGRYLVTCQDTAGQVRSFYSGVEQSARRIPRLRAAILYVRGKLPARKRVTA
jgi:hypothetical protein